MAVHKPPRYRAVRALVMDSRIGEVGASIIIHADNPQHARALAKALNAYEHSINALRRIVELSPETSECYQIAMDALEKVGQVIVL